MSEKFVNIEFLCQNNTANVRIRVNWSIFRCFQNFCNLNFLLMMVKQFFKCEPNIFSFLLIWVRKIIHSFSINDKSCELWKFTHQSKLIVFYASKLNLNIFIFKNLSKGIRHINNHWVIDGEIFGTLELFDSEGRNNISQYRVCDIKSSKLT